MIKRLILASQSPRRKELLSQVGVVFTVITAEVEETKEGTAPQIAVTNAVRKAECVAKSYPDQAVLGADTVVCVDREVFGKPSDREEAVRMLTSLSGRWHQVYTGVALCDGGTTKTACCKTDVHFVQMTEAEIRNYVDTGEPFGKAGAYAIQGRAGYYIDRIEGSFSNVIGLPLTDVREMLSGTDDE